MRLEGLADTPIGFGRTLADEQGDTEADWRAGLAREGVRVQAVVDGEPVAQAGGFPGGFPGRSVPDGAITVFGVFVRPGARGQGLLGLLVEEIALWGRENDLHLVRLDVHEDNPRAQRAYEKLGFALDGTQSPYPLDEGKRLLGMRRTVRP